MALFRAVCAERGIMSDPDECFRYMRTLPERDRQIDMFELLS